MNLAPRICPVCDREYDDKHETDLTSEIAVDGSILGGLCRVAYLHLKRKEKCVVEGDYRETVDLEVSSKS